MEMFCACDLAFDLFLNFDVSLEMTGLDSWRAPRDALMSYEAMEGIEYTGVGVKRPRMSCFSLADCRVRDSGCEDVAPDAFCALVSVDNLCWYRRYPRRGDGKSC